MARSIDIQAIRSLSVPERLALIDMIWQTITPDDNSSPAFSDGTKAEVRRRIQELRDNPEAGMSIDEARTWLRSRSKA